MGLQSSDLEPPRECVSEFELLDHGLQQSVASLEQALQQVRLEQHLLQRNRSMSSKNDCNGSLQLHHHGQAILGNNSRHNQETKNLWTVDTTSSRASRQAAAASAFQLGPSLFFFGDGGLPSLPSSLPDSDRSETESSTNYSIFLDAAPCTPFDFPHCDFLRESLPTLAWAAATREMPEYSLYEASPLQEDGSDSFCIVCLEQPACVHLVVCTVLSPSVCFRCLNF
jgi:hypothetical protein